MAFAYTLDGASSIGSMRKTYGTFTSSAGGTGGAIYVGLSSIKGFSTMPDAEGATLTQAVPTDAAAGAGYVTITSVADLTGYWEATGFGGG